MNLTAADRPHTGDHTVEEPAGAEQRPAVTPAAEEISDITDRITEAISANASNDNGDPEPGSLYAQLKLPFPPHAYWQHQSILDRIPEHIRDAVAAGAAHVIGVGVDLAAMVVRKATWSTPRGIWQVTFVPCPGQDHDGGACWHLNVDGPNTEFERQGLSHEQVVEKLYALDVVERPA